jgi:hypothetical protein
MTIPHTMRVKTRIPFYRPGGLPLRWQDDVTGMLPRAIRSYIAHRCGKGREPTAEELELVIDYLRHYLCAPCWNEPARRARDEHGDDWLASRLITIRLDICEGRVKTSDGIAAWICRCLEIGIDPL